MRPLRYCHKSLALFFFALCRISAFPCRRSPRSTPTQLIRSKTVYLGVQALIEEVFSFVV